MDFAFTDNKKFKVENCQFVLMKTEIKALDAKAFKPQRDVKKLGGLEPCTKYEIKLTIQNPAMKTFTYHNFVFTKLDAETKLLVKVDKAADDSARLSWSVPKSDASCLTNFVVTVKDKKNQTVFTERVTDRTVVVPSLPQCEIFTAQVTAHSVKDETVSSQLETFSLKPNGEENINKLELNVDEVLRDSVSLSWTSDSTNCLQEYRLKLRDRDDKIIYDASVFTNSTVISDLTSCNNYSVELIALGDDKTAVKAAIKTFYVHSRPIENATISMNNTRATITWIAPPNLDCVANFTVAYIIDACDSNAVEDASCSGSQIVDKTKTTAKFSSLPLAERFTLNIYANEVTSLGDARQAKSWTFDTIDYGKFIVQNILEFRRDSKELQLQWADIGLKKILKHFEVFFEGKVLTTERHSIVLNISGCNKSHAVVIRCISTDGYKGANVTYHTKLSDDFTLSPVANFRYEPSAESGVVSWSFDKDEASCIAHFEIDFNDYQAETKKARFDVGDIAPCTVYEITVTPISLNLKAGMVETFHFTSQEFRKNF